MEATGEACGGMENGFGVVDKNNVDWGFEGLSTAFV
jgi:hypothetical protein